MVVKEETHRQACVSAFQDQNKIVLNSVKNDFYESNDMVKWTIYVKELDVNSISIDFNETSGFIRFKTFNELFLHENKVTDKNTVFEWHVVFTHRIQPKCTTYKLTRMNLELVLKKEDSSIKWTQITKSKSPSSIAKIENTTKKYSESSQTEKINCAKIQNENDGQVEKEISSSHASKPLETMTTSTKEKSALLTTSQPSTEPLDLNNGLVGLVNLGNTCYMNAALQMLVNVTDLRSYFLESSDVFKSEINKSNALGLNGNMAVAFYMLFKQLWTNKIQRSITPTKLRDLICQKYAHFRGYEQQDTQEFMCSLLSVLHEDLNRVLKKPYYESSLECEDDNLKKTYEVAVESWKRFLTRENSVVVDNFYGQFKSKLTCPECNHISITFEPFSNLLVPIPKPKKLVEVILMFSQYKNRLPHILNFHVNETDTIRVLIDQIVEKYEDLTNSFLKGFIANKTETNLPTDEENLQFDTDWTSLSSNDTLSTIDSNKNFIIINEISESNEFNELVFELRIKQVTKYPIYQKPTNECSFCGTQSQSSPDCELYDNLDFKNFRECQKNDWQKHKSVVCCKPFDRVGLPFIILFKKSELVHAKDDEIEAYVRKKLYLMCLMSVQVENLTEKDFDLELYDNKSDKYVPIVFDKLIQQYENATETNFSIDLNLKWKNFKANVRTNIDKFVQVDDTTRVQTNQVTLDDCLKLFTQPERLTSDNPWYCSKCKKHQEALKQMNVWKLPKYLIITLKRFQASKAADNFSMMNSNDPAVKYMMMNSRFSYLLQNRVVYTKINSLVKFPLRDLDMSDYVLSSNQTSNINNENCIYDLCGVINHLGKSISLGHYTSFARTHDKNDTLKDEIGWRLFDDQNVQVVKNEEQVVSKEAYVLMYRLRTTSQIGNQQQQKQQENKMFETSEDKTNEIQTRQDLNQKQPLEQHHTSDEGETEYYDIESEESAELKEGVDADNENEDDEDKNSKFTDLNEID